MHAFDTPGKTRLRVKNAAGLVSVDPSENGRTTVELEALRDDDATREAIERAKVELNGNEVLVEIGVGGKGFGVARPGSRSAELPRSAFASAARKTPISTA